MKCALCALIPILSITLSACRNATPATASFQAMDTVMSLTVYGDEKICEELRERIEALDALFDATDANSEIARLNTGKKAAVSGDTADLLRRSLTLCEHLGGAFDITVYPAVQAWGFVSGDYRVLSQEESASLAERTVAEAVHV